MIGRLRRKPTDYQAEYIYQGISRNNEWLGGRPPWAREAIRLASRLSDSSWMFRSDGPSLPAGHEAIDEKHDDRTDDGTDKSCALTGTIPAKGLPKIGRHECADDAENGGENEAGRLIVTGHDELGYDTRNKADDDRPQNTHFLTPQLDGLRLEPIIRRATAPPGCTCQ